MSLTNLPPATGAAPRAQTVFGSEISTTDDQSSNLKATRPDARRDQRDYTDEECLQEARDFLDDCDDKETENRNRANEMLRFCYRRGAQWPDKVRRERETDNRPCLEVNQMPQYINQVCNDERQNRPTIKVRPVSMDATEENADLLADLIRHIEYDSNAPQVYDNAFRYCVAANTGYIRLETAYVDDKSFEQKILYTPIPDPLAVYYDPDCKEPDGSDADKCLITCQMTKDEFERAYPHAAPIDWQTQDPGLGHWVEKDGITVADYFHKVYWTDTLYRLPDGSIAYEGDDPEDGGGVRSEFDPYAMPQLALMGSAEPPPLMGYIDKREVDRCQVRWETLNGVEILKENEWAGAFIPIVPVWGDTTFVEGQVIRQGLIERAVDMQQMANFWVTTAAEAAAMQTKAPWLLPKGSISSNDDARKWGQANTKTFPYMEYEAMTEDGKPLPPPQRNSPDVDVSGILNQYQLCVQSMQTTIGIRDPLQTMQPQDESGRAILAKERVSDTATFHFLDNLSRALRYLGKQTLELIPHIYDTPRTLQLLKEDGETYAASINQSQPQPPGAPPTPRLNDLTVGSYDVMVDVGPSYQTARIEFVNNVMELNQSSQGQLWGIGGDLLVKNMDFPAADTLADRMKVMLPPQILQMEASKSKDPMVAALNTQMQQQGQQFQQQSQAMGAEMQKLQQDNQRLQGENIAAKANAATSAAQAKQRDVQAQADVQIQQMESRDVAMHTAIDMRQQDHKEKMDEKDFALQVMDRVLTAIGLQQKQMQPIGPEIAADNQTITRTVATDAAAGA